MVIYCIVLTDDGAFPPEYNPRTDEEHPAPYLEFSSKLPKSRALPVVAMVI